MQRKKKPLIFSRTGKPSNGKPTASVCLEHLENRVLFSADVFGLNLIDQHGQVEPEITNDVTALLTDSNQSNTSSPELIFIDSRLQQRVLIIDDLLEQKSNGRDIEIIVIEPDQNGIDVISKSLAGSNDISAVHLLSHGTNNGIQLGNIWLLESNVEFFLNDLTEWSSSLADDADLLIYGCNLAGSDSGLRLLEALEQSTKADVAASSDVTGHNNLGADWTLEHTSGVIETQPVLTEDAQAAWEYEMAAFLANDDYLLPRPINTSFTVGGSINADENILINDDYSSQPVIKISDAPNNGTLTPDASQTDVYHYTPNTGYAGSDSFEYTAIEEPDIRYHWLLNDTGSTAVDQTITQDGDITGTLPFDGNDYVIVPSVEHTDSFTLSFDFQFNNLSVGSTQTFFDQGTFGTTLASFAGFPDAPDPGTIMVWAGNTSSIYGFATQIRGMGDAAQDYAIWNISAGNFNVGQWYNYTLTIDSANPNAPQATVYINGVQMGPSQTAGVGGFNIDGQDTKNVSIGAEYDIPGSGATGNTLVDHDMRDLRIYDGVKVPSNDPSQPHPPLNYDKATVNIDLQPNIGPVITVISDPDITETENAVNPTAPIPFPIEVIATDDVTVTVSTKDNLPPNLQNGTLQVPNTNASVTVTYTSANDLTLKGPVVEVNKELALLTYSPPANYHNENPLVDMVQDDLLTIKVDSQLIEAIDKDSGIQYDKNHTPLVNNELFSTDPLLGEIISLNTHGEHIALNNYNGLEPQEVTVAAWINLTDTIDTAEIISFRNVFGVRTDSNDHLQGYARYNGLEVTTNTEIGAYDLEDDGWHHVAFRIINGHQQLFLDGVKIGESYNNQPLDYNGADNRVIIGIDPNGVSSADTSFVGEIDDAFVFQRALHITEIEKLSQAQDTSLGITNKVPIRISPTNDAPSISGLFTGANFTEAQTNYVLLESSGNIAIEDVEADIRGSYDGYSITLQRSDSTWYTNETAPPNTSNTPNAADHFDANNGFIDNVNGVVLDSEGKFGTIDQNSGGVLKVTFEDTSPAVPVTKDRINSFLNSITYLNDDVAPPMTAEISWIFADNGHDNFGNTPHTNLSITGLSTVYFNRDNSTPIITNNNPLTAYFTASNIITQSELFTQDDDHVAADLRYNLLTLPQYGQLERTDGTILAIDDDFYQADIDSGVIAYVANPGTVDTTDQFLFSVFDGLDANVVNQTFTINVISDPGNQSPALSNIGAPVIFTEDEPPVAILGNANIQDVDSTTLQSVKITLNNGTTNDTLVLPNQTSGITGSFTAGVLSLTKTGMPGTLAEYEAAIRSTTFANSSQNPIVFNPPRNISIVLDDGNSSSTAVTRDIMVIPKNDAPSLANFSGSTSPPVFTENGSGVAITSSLSIADVDDDNIEQAYIEISNNFTAADVLYLPPDPVNYPNITGTFTDISTATPGLLTLSGSTIKSEYVAAIRSVEFMNTSDNPDLTDRTVSIYVNDGDDDSTALSRTISVENINDAPELQNLEPPSTPATYTENSTPVNITATAIVEDKDDTQIEFARVLLTNHIPGDTLALDAAVSASTGIDATLDVTASQIELRLENTASLAAYQSAIQAVTFENSTHTPTDTTRTVTIILNDGDNPSAPVTRNILVTAINDAPTIANIEPTTYFTENGQPVDITDMVTVDDLDDAQIEKAVITITNNVLGEDFLTFSGHPDINGQFIASTGTMTLAGPASTAAFETAIGSVSYNNTSEMPNTATRTVAIEVFDSEPNVPSNSLTRDIDIIEVPDVPTINGLDPNPAVYIEGGAAIPVFSTATTTDLDGVDLVSAKISIVNFVPGQDILQYTAPAGITGVFDSTLGELEFTGTSTRANYDAALQSVKYSNSSSNPSAIDRIVSVNVTDTTGEDSTPEQRVIEVHAIDNNPVISSIGTDVSFTENGSAVSLSAGIIVDDVDNSNIDSAVIKIDNYVASEDELLFVAQNGITGAFNTNNEFVLNGTTSLANYQTAIQSILYNNTSEDPDATTRTISITISNDLNSNTETKNITINPINDAPLVTNLETSVPANFTEGNTSTLITNLLDLDDFDSTDLTSTVISIVNFTSGEDELLFTNGNGISGAFDNSNGELTLSGIAPVADYEAAIRTVAYTNTSEDPSGATRTISIVADDGVDKSGVVYRDINIFPVNDAPILSPATNTTVYYTEDDAPTVFNGTVNLTDVDNDTLQSATITPTNHIDTEDALLFANQSTITHSFNATTGELMLSGAASLADYEAAIESIRYLNTSQNPTAGTRYVTVTVDDGAATSNVGTRDLVVQPIDDAPVITALETSAVTYTENQAAQTITDTVILSDVDNTNLVSATVTIGGMVDGDQLGYVTQGSIIGNYDATSGILELTGEATPTEYASALQSILFYSTNEHPTNAIRNLIIEVSDGTNQTLTNRDVAVTPVNDPPKGQDNTLSTDDKTSYTLRQTDFPFTDLENDSMSGIVVNTLPSSGTLTLANQPVAAASISATQLDSGDMLFTPDENSGVTQTSFTYSIIDTGGTTGNDVNTDVQPNTIWFDIEQVNDLPVPYLESINVDEGKTQDTTASGATSLLDNAFDADADTLTVDITVEPQFGTLAIDETTGAFSYVHNGSEDHLDQFTYTLSDGIATVAQTVDIVVSPINDAPTFNPATSAPVYYTEDGVPTVFTGTINLADVDNTTLQSATITLTNNIDSEDVLFFANQGTITHNFNAAAGELILSGVASLADYEAAIESVRYLNTSQDPTAGIRNITIAVNDGSATSNVGEREITVQAVNDGPVITELEASAVSYTENQLAQAITDAIDLSDVDSANLSSATITIDGMVAGDELVYVTQGNIVGNYDNSSGILELTGAATPNQYASAIQSVFFQSTSEDPTNIARNLLIEISDGTNQAFDTREVIVTPVNDAPTGQDNTVSTNDTDSYSFRQIDFPFTDLENDSMFGIVINTLPTSGILTLANQPLEVADIVTKAQIEVGDLLFTPNENSGVTQTSFTYSTKDTGGVADNGIDTDVQPNTFTFNIGQVNDLPVPSIESINVDEGGTQNTTASGANSLLDNAFDADADTLTVNVTAEPQFGILTIDENTGTFSYEHNGSEDHADQFTYTLSDGQATVEQTVDIIVSPINDPPTAITENFAAQTATFASPFSVELPISNFNDVDGDILTYDARVNDGTPQGVELPSWLTFTIDASTDKLVLSGSPTTDEPLNLIIIASDAVSSVSSALHLTINPATELQIASATAQAEQNNQTSLSEPESEATDEGTAEASEPISFTQEIADEEPTIQTPIEVFEKIASYDNNSTNSNRNDLLLAAKQIEQHRNFQLKTLTDSSNLLLVQENTPLADLFYTDERTELLKKADLAKKLDEEREVLEDILSIDTRTIGGAVSVSTGLSIGYVIWLVRGGLLLSSVMSALPAWRNIDPLPVLSALTEDSDVDDDSLEDMVTHSPEEVAPEEMAPEEDDSKR